MRFSNFILLPLSTLVICSPLVDIPPDNGEKVRDAINDIHTAVQGLDTTVRNYQGGSPKTVLMDGKRVLSGVAEIHKANREGFNLATSSDVFSVDETKAIVEAAIKTGMYISTSKKHRTLTVTSEHKHPSTVPTPSRKERHIPLCHSRRGC
jgi:hypothetical protein